MDARSISLAIHYWPSSVVPFWAADVVLAARWSSAKQGPSVDEAGEFFATHVLAASYFEDWTCGSTSRLNRQPPRDSRFLAINSGHLLTGRSSQSTCQKNVTQTGRGDFHPN
jgi:hypothetical protein